jgi:hypothetical protein
MRQKPGRSLARRTKGKSKVKKARSLTSSITKSKQVKKKKANSSSSKTKRLSAAKSLSDRPITNLVANMIVDPDDPGKRPRRKKGWREDVEVIDTYMGNRRTGDTIHIHTDGYGTQVTDLRTGRVLATYGDDRHTEMIAHFADSGYEVVDPPVDEEPQDPPEDPGGQPDQDDQDERDDGQDRDDGRDEPPDDGPPDGSEPDDGVPVPDRD